MKKGIFALLFLVFATHAEANLFTTIKQGLKTCEMYKSVHRKELVEITEELLASDSVHLDVKRLILEKGRRVFLFEYPSDGMQIKGYISFVPKAQEQNLLVFMRGGSGVYDVKSPGDRINFWGDHTIISSTYRSGPSPGRDEFGGRDVVDVKNLVDHIPRLEQQLGISFTQKEKIAVGFSRGGMQLFLALKRFPELGDYFDRAVSVCGVLDLEHFSKGNPFFARLIRFTLLQRINQSWIDARNPLKICHTFPKGLPLLVIQGTNDQLVALSEGKEMVSRLRAQGVSVSYREKEGVSHCHHSFGETVNEWLLSSARAEAENP